MTLNPKRDGISIKWILITTLIVSLILLGIFVSARDAESASRNKEILYFAASSDIDPLLASSELTSRNITIVQNFTELRSLENTMSDVGAIIIHESRLEELDKEWMQTVYLQGTVVAGLNVTIKELASVVDERMVLEDPVWTDGWQQEPYFSILSYKPNGDKQEQALAEEEGKLHATIMRTTDNISDDNFGMFFYTIDRDMRIFEGEE